MAHLGHGAAGQQQGPHNAVELLAHHHQIGAVLGDLGARADGDAKVCRSQGRGVVDAITHHRQGAVGRMIQDALQLLLGPQFPGQLCISQTQPAAQLLHRLTPITTEQAKLQIHAPQRCQHRRRVRAGLIIDCY